MALESDCNLGSFSRVKSRDGHTMMTMSFEVVQTANESLMSRLVRQVSNGHISSFIATYPSHNETRESVMLAVRTSLLLVVENTFPVLALLLFQESQPAIASSN